MSVEQLQQRIADQMWKAVDDGGIEGRLYRQDCDYLARVALGVMAPDLRRLSEDLELGRRDYREIVVAAGEMSVKLHRVLRLISGRPGYHVVTVKDLFRAMAGDDDDEGDVDT